MGGPAANHMIRALDTPELVYVKQKPKGVCLECFCCAQNDEFGIGSELGGWSPDGSDALYVVEDTSLFCRFCFGTCRESKLELKMGGTAEGQTMAAFFRPLRCLVGPCKCCCFQEIKVTDSTNQAELGSVREAFWCCVPSFKVLDHGGDHVYDLHQPTCCGGCCVNCFDKGGCGCLRVPFYFYPPGGKEEERNGELVKIWAGLKKECCTNANNFELRPPKGAEPHTMPLVYASTVLLNSNFFEGE